MNPTPTSVYLLYADDGATLVYAGTDAAEFERRAAALTERHAGSLTGRRSVGVGEEWTVRAFFRERPPQRFIDARKGFFRFRLDWTPAVPVQD